MGKLIFYFFITISIVACSLYPSNRDPADVVKALKRDGSNRKELESVLGYYDRKPEDSLKLCSAFFLISNMLYHYTERDPKMEAFMAYILENEINGKSRTNFQRIYGHNKAKRTIKPDIQLAITDAQQTIYKEIQIAYSNAVAAQKVCLSSYPTVKSTHKSYQYAEESYDAGRSSVFEYNEAKTKYIQSLSEQKQAIFDLIFRCKILDFYSGIPITL